MDNEKLQDAMKKVLANTFVMYMKTHGYHWNVIGSDFPQLHSFFEKFYEELWGAVDPIAEHIRAIDGFAPGTIARMIELSDVDEDELIPVSDDMVRNILDANKIVLTSLKEAYILANEAKEDGLANFLQDRMDIHAKHGWMLKATLGEDK
jgi:starvation-inducible DNA-binding protein